MKLLHTADWHLGKRLHQHDLSEDHRLFFDWLLETIRERQIDWLLIAGDLFDTAFPPTEATTLYYEFLHRLLETRCKLLITGGNHDSPAVLNAPAQLLGRWGYQVLGGACPDPCEEIVPLHDASGRLAAAVCAVPYLRERDLRKALPELGTAAERRHTLQQGIEARYRELHQQARSRFAEVPLLGVGHLFVQGATTSDPDDGTLHQLGTLDAFGLHLFPEFDYLALGHIHRPQQLGRQPHVRYAGSPIPLDFSERDDRKQVVEITIQGPHVTAIEPVEVPVFRELKRFKGPFEGLEDQLRAYTHHNPLTTLAEIHITEARHDSRLAEMVRTVLTAFSHPEMKLLKWRFFFGESSGGLAAHVAEGTDLRELSAREVFDRWLDEHAHADDREGFASVFDELFQAVATPS